jgi:hypothetical protein
MCAIVATDKHASASMQGLADKEAANVDDTSNQEAPVLDATSNNSQQVESKQADSNVADRATSESWTTPEKIGGPISVELAQNSSANNSAKGSRSSGLQELGILFRE